MRFLGFAVDGATLAIVSRDAARLLQVSNGLTLAEQETTAASGASTSDGASVATGHAPGGITVWCRM